MYFKKLELVGFKSFIEKTTLHFEPGMTAIVGPNGSGKSNLFDAICWVLGEQSARSLRGLAMEDVIFNGTDLKSPLGMAEVSLTFDNENNFFPLHHKEVVITRRIYRSGESEYLLNKTPVRLKDIQDLLMGTGIGADNYSLVAQGKVELILSSHPDQRRLVFDEAAGITKYKMQKKEALRKLEETEANLLRLNDIIAEVKRQIVSLERQANKARRYKEIFEALKTREINLAVLHKQQLDKEKEKVSIQLEASRKEEAQLKLVIAEEENKLVGCQQQLVCWEENISGIKNQLATLENIILRDREHIGFNQKRIEELEGAKKTLGEQIEGVTARLFQDEHKLASIKEGHLEIKKGMEEKNRLLQKNEVSLKDLILDIEHSLQEIAQAKKDILRLVTEIAGANNEIAELSARQSSCFGRKKRLEIEKLKVKEEKAQIEDGLSEVALQLQGIQQVLADLGVKTKALNEELENLNSALNQAGLNLENLEKEKLTLESQKEFLEELKIQYAGIDTSLNATVYLDKLPAQKLTGLLVKIKEIEEAEFKLSGEAKPLEMDTAQLMEKIRRVEEEIIRFKEIRREKEERTLEIEKTKASLYQQIKEQEISLANKNTAYQGVCEQLAKIKEEGELVEVELSEVDAEISALDERLNLVKAFLTELDKEHKVKEDLIHQKEERINASGRAKEETAVCIGQLKTELEVLSQRLDSEENTLKMLEEALRQDKEGLLDLERQIAEGQEKQKALQNETQELENRIIQTKEEIEGQRRILEREEDRHKDILAKLNETNQKIKEAEEGLGGLKDRLHDLQIQEQDLDFKQQTIRERMSQVYKIDLETQQNTFGEIAEDLLTQEIERLKEKLDSLGNVNLVAIEEYDELKERYDFLTQQQNDLISSRSSLKEAIQKISRTTRDIFFTTFEKIHQEFKNYFRLLFNGGDAQLFLIDEEDPLESGIEIICRPPGKKLQNVLSLSGGEKTLSAIALIFAIFKVKPAPFCVLDEIDAALDEANVDRFAMLLKEFTDLSQFIVITHNKRTIANADVMYGITMEESGVSKIVSVKFSTDKATKKREEEAVAVAS